jgi:hypothetical protein
MAAPLKPSFKLSPTGRKSSAPLADYSVRLVPGTPEPETVTTTDAEAYPTQQMTPATTATPLFLEAHVVREAREITSDETGDQRSHAKTSTLIAAEIETEAAAKRGEEQDPEAPLAPEARAVTLEVESTNTLIPLPIPTMVR